MDKCPRCGAGKSSRVRSPIKFTGKGGSTFGQQFACGSAAWEDDQFEETSRCLRRQLAAKDKELAERAKDLVFFGELRDSCLVEQEKRDADYQRAREAWRVLKGPNLIIDPDDHTWESPRMHDPAIGFLNAYFNPHPSPEREGEWCTSGTALEAS